MKAKSQLTAHGLRGLTSTGVAVAASVAYVVLGGSLLATLAAIAPGMGGASMAFIVTSVIIVLMASLAVSTTLRATFAARVRQTGLVRAIGASSSHMRQMLLKQAMTVGVIGSIVGVLVGLGIVAVGTGIAAGAGASFAIFMPSLGYVVLALGVGILVTLLGVMRPTREAGRTSPVQAMTSAETLDTDIPRIRATSKMVNVVLLIASAVLLAIATGGAMAMLAPIAGILLCILCMRMAPSFTTLIAKRLPSSGKSRLGLAAESIRRHPRRAGALLALVVAGTATTGTLLLLASALMRVEVIDVGFIAEVMAVILAMLIGTLVVEAIAFAGATASSLKSRAQELSVLRAVGLTRRRMVGMLAVESGVIGAAGAIIGSLIALTVVGCAIMASTMQIGSIGLTLIAALVVATICVAVASTLIPAVRSSRRAPAHAVA